MTWHTDHFTCEECGCYLANMKFVNKNGKPFCKPCYEMIKARGIINIKNEYKIIILNIFKLLQN